MPTGWAEYTEVPGKTQQDGRPSYTVTLDTAPTQEQWDEYYPALQKELKEWREAQKAREGGGGGVRLDPKTGEPLFPGERPLYEGASYHITGRAKVSPKPWDWVKTHEIGCCYPVGASP